MRTPTLLAVATAALVALAGCGSSSSSNKTTTTKASATEGGGAYGHTGTTAAPGASTTASGGTAASGSGVVVVTKHSKDGTILAAGPKKLTVYLFEKDTGSSSTCNGPCAGNWPAVTTSAAPTAATGAMASELGTTTRADGTKQVTYHGHPLYFFVKDKDSGDAYGQGVHAFGAGWYVMKPSGEKIDES